MPAAPRRVALVAAACLAAGLSLGACDASKIGGDDSGTAKGKAAVAVVKKFAAAHGPEACNLLTPNALRAVYGGKEANRTAPASLDGPPPAYALAHCREASSKFEGQSVGIDKVTNVGDRAVKVQTSVDGGKAGNRLFDVTVRSRGNTWLVDEIREK
jgi:hypothetical protein